MMTLTTVVIMRYAVRVHRDPSLSLSAEEDVENRVRLRASPGTATAAPMTRRRALGLASLLGFFALLMVGLLRYEWGFTEIGALFFWMGIVVPVVGGLSVKDMIDKNIEGMKSVMIAVIMMSAAQIIIAYVMFGTSALMAALLGSASGTAAAVMPVLSPLADVLQFSKQIVVLAFQMASGAFNFWMPWDGIAFTICAMAGVNFFKYIKAAAKFAVLVYVPAALVLLALAVALDYR